MLSEGPGTWLDGEASIGSRLENPYIPSFLFMSEGWTGESVSGPEVRAEAIACLSSLLWGCCSADSQVRGLQRFCRRLGGVWGMGKCVPEGCICAAQLVDPGGGETEGIWGGGGQQRLLMGRGCGALSVAIMRNVRREGMRSSSSLHESEAAGSPGQETAHWGQNEVTGIWARSLFIGVHRLAWIPSKGFAGCWCDLPEFFLSLAF